MAKALKIVGGIVAAVAIVATGIGMILGPGAGTFLGMSGATWGAIGGVAGCPTPACNIGTLPAVEAPPAISEGGP